MEKGGTHLSSVLRAFDILEYLSTHGQAGPTEIATAMDIPQSTAHDYLRTLGQTDFVISNNGSYSLSSYFMTMGGRMRFRNQLFQVARHEMRRVARETGELVGLTIEEEGMAIILNQEEGDRALSLGTYPGATTPLHTNASGKSILAFLPEGRVSAIVAERGLEQRTEHTITDPDELEDELETIRETEVAVDWDQHVVGMGMAATPLIVEEDVLGSICIVVPTGRMQEESYQEELLQQLSEIKHTIEINYQYGR